MNVTIKKGNKFDIKGKKLNLGQKMQIKKISRIKNSVEKEIFQKAMAATLKQKKQYCFWKEKFLTGKKQQTSF